MTADVGADARRPQKLCTLLVLHTSSVVTSLFACSVKEPWSSGKTCRNEGGLAGDHHLLSG